MPKFLILFVLFVCVSCSSPPATPKEDSNQSQKQLEHLNKEMLQKVEDTSKTNGWLKGVTLAVGACALIIGASIGTKARIDSQKSKGE